MCSKEAEKPGSLKISRISDLTPPLLVFGYGNPSRGDDALGPLLIERLEALDLPNVELLTDFQLQIEHALDLQSRERVLFVDTSISCVPPYAFSRLLARKDVSFTSHVMSPIALLYAYLNLYGPPPPAYLIEIRGDCFELGEPLGPRAAANLDASFQLARRLCSNLDLCAWEEFVNHEQALP
ncbi:hydrogenase maturation protease [Nitrosospira multiformis]|uniref:HoxW protein n=1 Tax=Nitrosospira multiformis (strain ATCC 25196 / NCIMB 11849 / C 71) TaxID=323848 RepID=Q2Y8E8_NITMU|nr:hydrogenase maturation protease [Nitrosospira multiformis]ABB74973.1 HoxW protein [Nitrosospira multiformis ATCC 25196]SEA57213.1 hydrogenase maturation protease [Nitrosospira multiformis]SEG00241.1 hydrogenase maturation protease [Nitrosospira multiformis ATCC 25196]